MDLLKTVRNLSKTKSGHKVRNGDKALTYTRIRELFIEVFRGFVPDISQYGLHSLRAGGATVCANSGISDRLFIRNTEGGNQNQRRMVLQR